MVTLQTVAGDVEGAASKTLWRLWDVKFVILFLFLAGLLLVALQREIIWMAPKVEKHINVMIVAWNAIGDIMEIMFVAIKVAIGAIVEGVHLLEGKGKSVPWPIANLKFKAVNSRDAVEAAFFLPTLCKHYGTADEIVRGIFDRQVGPRACMLVRSLYPTPMRNVSDAMLGWAVGDRDTVPFGLGNGPGTCASETPEMSIWCVAFGSGALILEVLLPLLIAVIVLCSWKSVVADAVKILAAPINHFTERALEPPPPYNAV